MLPRLLPAVLLAFALLSGCADNDPSGPDDDGMQDPLQGLPGTLYNGTEPVILPSGKELVLPPDALFASAEPLYVDPQNTPHPTFNWPTLVYPAMGSLPNKWWAVANSTSLPTTITDLALVSSTEGVPTGAGIAIFGSLVVVPGYGAPTAVVDISDPTNPTVLSTFEPQENITNHRGAAFIPYPDGRLVTVISTGAGIDVWDLTDPTMPAPLPPLFMDGIGSHKVGVIPGTPIVVNAASDGGSASNPATSTGVNQMWDLTDPDDPIRLDDFANGYSCHHVYFWNDLDAQKFRGVCAGIQYTQIWDTADPYNPSVIVSVAFGTGGTPLEDTVGSQRPAANIAHYAGLSIDGNVLLVGDESGGGGSPPGCVARVDVPGVGAVSVPIGAVWFYDVSDEQNPQYLGHYSASQLDKFQDPDDPTTPPDPMNGDPQRSCTAHHGRMVPIDGRDILAMSWYNSGVVVVDFTNVRNEGAGLPMTVAQFADNSDVWETWYYNGYLYTGDLARGMDVLRLV
jgi:hypothetical protein